jgi:hypothetical protein
VFAMCEMDWMRCEFQALRERCPLISSHLFLRPSMCCSSSCNVSCLVPDQPISRTMAGSMESLVARIASQSGVQRSRTRILVAGECERTAPS